VEWATCVVLFFREEASKWLFRVCLPQDPITFTSYGTFNIYEDANAYVYTRCV
jgi:hypothetical protein